MLRGFLRIYTQGDEILNLLKSIRNTLRDQDTIRRWQKDEFVRRIEELI